MFEIVAANTTFLWMLPLAGLPVLFHLFLRVRKRTRPFSSLMFFRRADPRLRARKKLREWLALLLRILAVAFMLLALARPLWLGAGGGGPVSRVLLVDNSGSMTGHGAEERTRLSHAMDAAAALVGEMRDSDSAALVLLVDDVEAAAPEGMLTAAV